MADVEAAGIGSDRLRHVPHGVDATVASAADVDRVRARHDLPAQFVLFVGTIEPRKNLERLVQAVAHLDEPLPLVIAGADGWGGVAATLGRTSVETRFLGFVDDRDLPGLYAAATVFAYPSVWEGFGMPVAEAMVQGTPVITSRGTSTAEVAGGAAVLIDPLDVDDIARGLTTALGDRDRLHVVGRARAAEMTWEAATAATRRGVRRGPSMRLDVAVNLLWCTPGEVGGSEEYLVRQLTGLGELDSDVAPTLCCTTAFADAHPELATRFPMRSPGRLGGRRSARIVAEHTWLARQIVGVRRRPPRWWHDAADRTPADPADRARPAVPRATRSTSRGPGCTTCG